MIIARTGARTTKVIPRESHTLIINAIIISLFFFDILIGILIPKAEKDEFGFEFNRLSISRNHSDRYKEI